MVLINNYSKQVWIRTELGKGMWLKPGERQSIDGFKPPKWGGDWLKLSDKFDTDATCTIDLNGDFRLRNYNYGFLHGNSAIFKTPMLYNHLPGRKGKSFFNWKNEPKK